MYKSYCFEIDHTLQLLENNIDILRNIKTKQEKVRDIHRANFQLLGGELAFRHVEERLRQSSEMMDYHQKIKDNIMLIRNIFPPQQKPCTSVSSNVTDEHNSCEVSFIETRPLPKFWNY